MEGIMEHTSKSKIAQEKLIKLISKALIQLETLTKEQIDYIVETGKIPKEPEEGEE